jgi:uncharacterized protein YfdQ (DUF2303 family)
MAELKDSAPVRENLAETLAREMKQPVVLFDHGNHNRWCVATPPGWTQALIDEEKLLDRPRRKTAQASLSDAESFVAYVKRHGSLTECTVWCKADYRAGQVAFKAIVNDHGEEPDEAAWRDHTASFTPEFSEEWKRWTAKHKQPFAQADFAAFLEENLKDIAGVSDGPSGTQMLEMALSFEANQDMRFKSAIRLQNGGVQMSFAQDDDAQTLTRMQVFERFSLGMPVFWNGEAYRIDARLRYRVRDGKLSFWFELIRPDKVLEAAAQTLIAKIRGETGNPFFFGDPGLKG